MTGAEIAEVLSMAHSTVSGILTKIGMGKLGRLGLEPAVRYERERPGELIHIDVKKLGRIHDGAGHRVTGQTRALHGLTHRRRRPGAQDRWLGVRARRGLSDEVCVVVVIGLRGGCCPRQAHADAIGHREPVAELLGQLYGRG